MDGNGNGRILNANTMVQSDGYYIGTKSQCNYYDDKVKGGENYQGTTTRWAEPREHPTNGTWAIVKHKNYEHSNMTWVAELDNTWDPGIQDPQVIE